MLAGYSAMFSDNVNDLFRYNAAGNRTFTTARDDAYLSIDGMTKLARFHQDAGGDYGDFWRAHGGNVRQVQDALHLTVWRLRNG